MTSEELKRLADVVHQVIRDYEHANDVDLALADVETLLRQLAEAEPDEEVRRLRAELAAVKRESDAARDRAQAMELVEKFPIECAHAITREWTRLKEGEAGNYLRAICECAAKVQKARNHG